MRHYAGDVEYDVRGFSAKNKETISDDLAQLFGAKQLAWLSGGGASPAQQQQQQQSGLGLGSGTADSPKRRGSMRHPTASEYFRSQLTRLMASVRGDAPRAKAEGPVPRSQNQ